MHPLIVEQLTLTNFRNYRQASLEARLGPVVLCGHNGAGKTNILEAISLLTAGRGIRNAKLSDIDCQLPNHAGEHPFAGVPWTVYANVNCPEGMVTISTGRDVSSAGDKRLVKIDNELQPSQVFLGHVMSVIALTPQMDQTFSEGSTSRRDYLDRLVTVFFPEHVRHLGSYEHFKAERRKLLQRPNPDKTWLSSLEKKMAENGIAIAATRVETLQHLTVALSEQHEQNSDLFPKAVLSIEGIIEEALSRMSALEAENLLREKLEASRATDAAVGRTHVGPHRSDFVVFHPVRQLRAELCSTGEQKALLLSITLAVVRAKQAWMEVSPVVLLDEVVSHLDHQKRDALLEEIMNLEAQCWLTGTEKHLFSYLKDEGQFLTIENARIVG